MKIYLFILEYAATIIVLHDVRSPMLLIFINFVTLNLATNWSFLNFNISENGALLNKIYWATNLKLTSLAKGVYEAVLSRSSNVFQDERHPAKEFSLCIFWKKIFWKTVFF